MKWGLEPIQYDSFLLILLPEAAERSLRPAVIYRKTSGGSRSGLGADAYARLHSIFYATKIRKKSFIRDIPGMMASRKPHPG